MLMPAIKASIFSRRNDMKLTANPARYTPTAATRNRIAQRWDAALQIAGKYHDESLESELRYGVDAIRRAEKPAPVVVPFKRWTPRPGSLADHVYRHIDGKPAQSAAQIVVALALSDDKGTMSRVIFACNMMTERGLLVQTGLRRHYRWKRKNCNDTE